MSEIVYWKLHLPCFQCIGSAIRDFEVQANSKELNTIVCLLKCP